MLRHIVLSLLVLGLLAASRLNPAWGASVSEIIPAPEQISFQPGQLQLTPATRIVVRTADPDARFAGDTLAKLLNRPTGWKLRPVVNTAAPTAAGEIELTLADAPKELGREGYQVSVNSDRAIIRANSPVGLFYGVQTLRQLLPPQIESRKGVSPEKSAPWAVPCVQIQDKPRYTWRGLMLDCSRHFFPKEFIYKYLDEMAKYKFNTFHWHLVDDQGWRIEIKKYPKLTEVGAWRADRTGVNWRKCTPQQPGEKATYGGFYTQAEIKKIIEYARQRGITIVPEIEMPGHSRAVLAAYPEFLCSRKALPVATGGASPENAWCAGREGTFEFLDNVLDEVIDLFPSQFIHIGGDECDKTFWKKCPDCQRRMREEKLKNEEELQSYFIRRIEKHINERGRRLIGWDEILEGGLAPNATVMSWRSMEGGIKASQAGHDVVMSPTQWCYIDYYQGQKQLEPEAIGGYLPVSKVYSFDPTPAGATPEQAKHILGGQANLWAEYVPTPSHAEYMTFPRAFAMSEALWSGPEHKDWADFSRRMQAQFERLERRGVNFARSAFDVHPEAKRDKTTNETVVKLSTEIEGLEIRYTTNGSEPAASSDRYTAPLKLKGPLTLKAAGFRNGKPAGRVSTLEVK